ncbi:hypothetical protein K523DRAFT_314053 [Schizophyllum commune Tattone D]|nr:hypothetical protein K525DRAFT_192204 [Schizophyllum commune Loenen D]KAI5825086.1 hypothetical protein K523DRAFT_314053 [Schizophyllum commune Tattone D]
MFFVQALFALGAAALAAAETHTIHFDNACGYGTPVIYQNFQQISSGDHTFNGPASAVIAFLQTGNCGANGENCSMVEFTLVNGGVSSTDVTLIPPHTFSVPTGFGYYNGCDGVGNDCTSANCAGAFHKTDDYGAQRQCTADNVNLAITFCK